MTITEHTIRFYWRHASRYPGLLAGELVSLAITFTVGSYVTPLIVAEVLGRLSRHAYIPGDIWGSFGGEIILYSILQVGVSVIGWRIADYFVFNLEGRVHRAIAREVFAHLVDMSPNFHANRFSGSLVSQASKLMNSYVRFTDTTAFRTLPLVCGLIFTVSVFAVRAPLYAIVMVAFTVALIGGAIALTGVVRRRAAEHAAAESAQTGNLADALGNVMAIKSFAASRLERARFQRTTNETYRRLLRFMDAHQRRQVPLLLMGNGMQVASLVMALVSAVLFHADLSTVFLIVSYTSTIASSVSQFNNNALRDYNRALGDAADMIDILHAPPEIKDPTHPEAAHIDHGAIGFDHVSFTHDGSTNALFRDLTLSIQAGEKIGLVGHSGSGKTTFTRLLLRFSDIQGGAITIDGQDISHITQDDLRRHIAYVPQEPILFHRTLQENISYGDPDASLETVREVAKLAHADEFISVLPEQYNTLVGERGVKLSGGQRQRIAIARAMLKNAPILVLDEATAALDSESEALIQDALWKLMEGRTAIVVAHRLSTIQKMDRIIVMDEGMVIEQGTHTELLAKNGQYAALWRRQSGGFISE